MRSANDSRSSVTSILIACCLLTDFVKIYDFSKQINFKCSNSYFMILVSDKIVYVLVNTLFEANSVLNCAFKQFAFKHICALKSFQVIFKFVLFFFNLLRNASYFLV